MNMTWKIIKNSEQKTNIVKLSGKCPILKKDAIVSSIFEYKQLCKTDIQKTPVFISYECNLWTKSNANEMHLKCNDCPFVCKKI